MLKPLKRLLPISISLQLTLVIIACIGMIAIISQNYQLFQDQLDERLAQMNEKRSIFDKHLDTFNRLAPQELTKIHEEILKHQNYSLSFIQSLLNPQAYRHEGMVRFVWVDANDHIRVSSHTQYPDLNLDISKRDYIKQARTEPGRPHFSALLEHISRFTHIVTLSIGIQETGSARYVGTIMATMDMHMLKQQLMPLLQECDCLFTLYSPKGETILQFPSNQQQTPQATVSPSSSFTYQLGLDPAWLTETKKHAVMQTIIWCSAFAVLLFLLYALLRFRILRPLSQALTLVPGSAAASQSLPVAQTIEQLGQLADNYNAMQQRLQEQENMLSECGQIISQLQSQQARFLEASSGEMQQMFTAITHYAEHLEELVYQQQLHPDAPYEFDDVREMGENLRHLSECFVTFSKQEDIKTEAADPARILQQNLLELEPFMERRNLRFTLTKDREVWVMQPGSAQLMHALIRAMLFTAVRFAEDESQLDISITSLDEQVILKLDVSRFRQSSLPAEQQDFGMFLSRMQRDMTTPIRDKLAKHANILIAEAISSKLNGDFRLEVPGGHRGFILCSQLAVQA